MTKQPTLSSTSQTCRQHISSIIAVTNKVFDGYIDVGGHRHGLWSEFVRARVYLSLVPRRMAVLRCKNEVLSFVGSSGGIGYGHSCVLEGFQFRWFKIKGIPASFPISITLFSNHLK